MRGSPRPKLGGPSRRRMSGMPNHEDEGATRTPAMPGEPLPLDPLVGAYYERAPEESRLEIGAFRLEEARTRELVLRHAASPPARILDLGGAAGAYAF